MPQRSMKVCVAEDEQRVRLFIKKGLEQHGMSVDAFESLDEVQMALATQKYDVLILDRLLKTEDSVFSIPMLRKKFPHQRILVLSALSDVVQRVQGLEYGADDYLGKPFHMEELISRIKSLSRRNEGAPKSSNTIEVLDIQIDLTTQKVNRAGQAIDLTPKELKLLIVLASAPHKLFTRPDLLSRAWDMNFDPESNVVDVSVGRLRRKINLEGLKPVIHSRRGLGYSFLESENDKAE
jgi:DNA-binding response OmpR family regulator